MKKELPKCHSCKKDITGMVKIIEEYNYCFKCLVLLRREKRRKLKEQETEDRKKSICSFCKELKMCDEVLCMYCKEPHKRTPVHRLCNECFIKGHKFKDN